MKNIKYVILALLLSITLNVKADNNTCDLKEFSRLKELAKKIEFDYEFKVVNGVGEFAIHAVNLNKDLKVMVIYDYFNDDYVEFKGTSEATVGGFIPGERIAISINGFVANPCSGETVLTKSIKLPYYNIFYDRDRCQGNEDFKYCKELIDNSITQEEFNQQFELYLKNKEAPVKEEEKVEAKDNTTLYLIIGGIVLALAIISILVINIIKRRNKNKL